MKADIAKGVFGMSATGAGVAASQLEGLKAWLQVASLGVGIAVGVASFVSIWLSIQWKRRRAKKEQEGNLL